MIIYIFCAFFYYWCCWPIEFDQMMTKLWSNITQYIACFWKRQHLFEAHAPEHKRFDYVVLCTHCGNTYEVDLVGLSKDYVVLKNINAQTHYVYTTNTSIIDVPAKNSR